MMTKYPMVEVIWLDATTHDGTFSFQEIAGRSMALAFSLGYLVSESDDDIRLVRTLFDDGDLRQLLIIPRGLVQKMQYLQVRTGKRRNGYASEDSETTPSGRNGVGNQTGESAKVLS